MNELIPICFATNDGYFPYMAVAMQSIMENASKARTYQFYVLHIGVAETNQQKLHKQLSVYPNCSVEYVNVSQEISKHTTIRQYGLGLETYFRFLIPYIFTSHKKVILLDCDVICLGNIEELFEQVPDNCMLGASRDFAMMKWKDYCHKIGIRNHLNYFNAGVLVFNQEFFRNQISETDLFNIAVNEELALPDQCMLNIACQDHTHFLNMAWNVMAPSYKKRPPKNYLPEFNTAQQQPKIIHYVWDKPWRRFELTERNRHFWKYARQTEFADTVFAKLKDADLDIKFDHRMSVYEDIRKHRYYDFRFILKSLSLFIRYKLVPASGKS